METKTPINHFPWALPLQNLLHEKRFINPVSSLLRHQTGLPAADVHYLCHNAVSRNTLSLGRRPPLAECSTRPCRSQYCCPPPRRSRSLRCAAQGQRGATGARRFGPSVLTSCWGKSSLETCTGPNCPAQRKIRHDAPINCLIKLQPQNNLNFFFQLFRCDTYHELSQLSETI